MLNSIEYYVNEQSLSTEHLKRLHRLLRHKLHREKAAGAHKQKLLKLGLLASHINLAISIRAATGLPNSCNSCKDCEAANKFYGEKINCQKHRKPDKLGFYRVGCRKCDAILKSYDPEDSLCGYCAL